MTSVTTEPLASAGLAPDAAVRRHHRVLRIWLALIALMIFAMVLVGGATRMTHSGLSITKWQPIVGMVPPLSKHQWETAFDGYKKIPQYKDLDPNMTLSGFKYIYWWEWSHRFLGRMIGFVFFIPFLVFWAKGYIEKRLWPKLIGLFVLGFLQGCMGWYMVESGLEVRTDVSQYRLAAHFGFAFIILAYTLWLIFSLSDKKRIPIGSRAPACFAGLIVCLVYLQLILGAFVSGTDAGFIYNTWPLIDGSFIPHGLFSLSPWFHNFFANQLTVQFDHRMMAYTLFTLIWIQAVWLAITKRPQFLVRTGLILALLVTLQASLGIWTLLMVVPIDLGLSHQAGAAILFSTALFHFWTTTHGVPAGQGQSMADLPQAAASA